VGPGESPDFTGFQPLQRQVALFHNADVPGSSPGVATIFIKGLASASPLSFLGSDYEVTTPCLLVSIALIQSGEQGNLFRLPNFGGCISNNERKAPNLGKHSPGLVKSADKIKTEYKA
jgi:hypothetical protein